MINDFFPNLYVQKTHLSSERGDYRTLFCDDRLERVPVLCASLDRQRPESDRDGFFGNPDGGTMRSGV